VGGDIGISSGGVIKGICLFGKNSSIYFKVCIINSVVVGSFGSNPANDIKSGWDPPILLELAWQPSCLCERTISLLLFESPESNLIASRDIYESISKF